MNEITVLIDYGGCDTWAVEVDWAAITLDENDTIRPAVFVHGWTGNAETFTKFRGFMDADGIPYDIPQEYKDGIAPIEETSPILVEAVRNATIRFGVDKVNVFAHSKGGLITRDAQRDKDTARKIAHLIAFSTPNHGTVGPKRVAWLQCDTYEPNAAKVEQCKEAARQLDVGHIRAFNFNGCRKTLFFGWTDCQPREEVWDQPGVKYSIILGGYLGCWSKRHVSLELASMVA